MPNADLQMASSPALHELVQVAQHAQDGDVPGAAKRLELMPVESSSMALHTTLQAALQGTLRIYDGHYQETLAGVLPSVAQLESSPLAAHIDWVYTSVAYALGMMGDPIRGLDWASRAMHLTDERPWSAGRRKVLSTRGTLLALVGDHEAAWTSLVGSLQVAEKEGGARGVVVALGNMAYCCMDEALKLEPSDPRRLLLAQRALPHAIAAVDLAQVNGLDLFVGFASTSRGIALLMTGDIQAAEIVLRTAVQHTASHLPMQVDAQLALAMVCRQQGRFKQGWEALGAAESAAQKAGVVLTKGRMLDEAVALALGEGRTDEALANAQRSTTYWRELHASRLKVLASHASLFAELEHSRREAQALRQESQAWADAAQQDPLTGLLNRRGLEASHQQLSSTPFGVALIDADHFKHVNDTLGHAKGDEVLVALAQVLREHTRRGDTVARIGGEEFVLLMPGATLAVLQRRCERIRQAIAQHPWHRLESDLAVTASIGCTMAKAGSDLDAPLSRADAALYQAKATGRDRVVSHHKAPSAH